MRSVLYLVRRSPGLLANESVEMMLVSGVFEQPARVLFMDDGVWQLPAGQDASRVGRKDTTKALGALATYGVEELHAHAPSALERGVAAADVALDVRWLGDEEARDLLHAADVVITD